LGKDLGTVDACACVVTHWAGALEGPGEVVASLPLSEITAELLRIQCDGERTVADLFRWSAWRLHTHPRSSRCWDRTRIVSARRHDGEVAGVVSSPPPLRR
jgi:hypothetical protein